MPPKNVVAPQGSTKLLAIKAPAEFPKMLSSSSILVSANKGESLSSTNLEEASKPSAEDMRMFMSRKTVVAFPQRVVVSSLEEDNLTTPATEGGLREELVEEETSSSSSSDSDSSSDSEGEGDNDSEVAIKTKVEFPRQDSVFSKNIAVKASILAKENLSQKSYKEYVAKKKPRKTATDVSPVKQVAFSKMSSSHETSKSKARDPKVKSTLKDQQKLVLKPHTAESHDLTDGTHKSDYLEEKSIGTQVAAIQLKGSSVTREDKKQKLVSTGEEKKLKEAQVSEAEVESAPKLEEETSESTVLIMGTTAKEETIHEAGVQAGERSTIEETTAAAEPAPEEFDNSTYKNLQHHEYNIYTFVDSVVVLSKFRQPQPSSGRPSPRH
ncbi:PREDICTED: NADH dehydrogenase [ubiquinone] flavoprotein 3, mitochondrial [Chlamydotis macqueenii]|uniref:NADH dehydrogenase [ubiquinone] flavoprotein 3, mitochondrial n=1 Tax=Chlamydotis macqueenii TaxID=187382 RepID=UPI0005295C3E|nr:PREDICTED: NADH dehydrogenase [ubiquinone] flavoprotein 3, mitochondrial [Chlamydotis macqueenii]